MKGFIEAYSTYRGELPDNIRLGVSVENSDYLWRVEELSKTPTVVHFVNLEPLLGPLPNLDLLHGIGQVIIGGESGPGARPMHPDWARNVRDQCQTAGIPFFFKSWGEYAPVDQMPQETIDKVIPVSYSRRWVFQDDLQVHRVGKKAAGRLLDGVLWEEYPAK